MDRIVVSAAGRAFRKLRRLGRQVGQGTVEYVALILLVTKVKSGRNFSRGALRDPLWTARTAAPITA
jgi:hypothetical protein